MADLIYISKEALVNIPSMGLSEANILVGGGQDNNKVIPNVNASFQCAMTDEQFFININRINVPTGNGFFKDNEFSLISGDQIDKWRVTGDRLKWWVEYGKDPRTGGGDYIEQWELKFSSGITFHKQPSIYAEFLAVESDALEPGPEIYGSYAVKHDRGSYRIVDKTGKVLADYGAGKLMHIYARYCFDMAGKGVWLEPQIAPTSKTTALMTVTIPKTFLDNAVFPVTLNDTFGYDTIGGSSTLWSAIALQIVASGLGAPGSDGTVTSIDLHSYNSNASNDVTAGLYSNDGGPGPGTKFGTQKDNQNVGTWGATGIPAHVWKAFSTNALSVTNGVNYWCTLQANADIAEFSYDVNAGTNNYRDIDEAYNAWNATFEQNLSSAADYSMRATYTPAAGGVVPLINAGLINRGLVNGGLIN